MLMNASVFISHTSQHFVMIMVVIAQQLLTDKQQIIWLYKVSRYNAILGLQLCNLCHANTGNHNNILRKLV